MLKGYVGKGKSKKYNPLLFQEVYEFFTKAPKRALKLFWKHLREKEYRKAINLLKQFLKIDISEDIIKEFLKEKNMEIEDIEIADVDWGDDYEEVTAKSKKKRRFLSRELPYAVPKKERKKANKYWGYSPAERISPTGNDMKTQHYEMLQMPKAYKSYNQMFIIGCDESEEDSNHVQWAIRELKYAKLLDNDNDPDLEQEYKDYNTMVAESVISVLREFSKARHSGFSASMARELLDKLLKWEALTPLSDNPDEWIHVSEHDGGSSGMDIYQSTRNPSCFSTDLKQYYNLNDKEKLYDLQHYTENKN